MLCERDGSIGGGGDDPSPPEINKIVVTAITPYDYVGNTNKNIFTTRGISSDDSSSILTDDVVYSITNDTGEATLGVDSDTGNTYLEPVATGWVKVTSTYKELSDDVYVYIFAKNPSLEVNYGEHQNSDGSLNVVTGTNEYVGMIIMDPDIENELKGINAELIVHFDPNISDVISTSVTSLSDFTVNLLLPTIPLEAVGKHMLHVEYKLKYDDSIFTVGPGVFSEINLNG